MICVVVASGESDLSLSPLIKALLGSFNDNYVTRKSKYNIYIYIYIYKYCQFKSGDFNPEKMKEIRL